MKNLTRATLVMIGASIALARVALADDPARAAKVKPEKMKCEDFLALDDVTRPKVIYWMEGFNKKGQGEDIIFDTEKSDRLVPVMVEVCGKEPQASFWTRAKAEWKKIF